MNQEYQDGYFRQNIDCDRSVSYSVCTVDFLLFMDAGIQSHGIYRIQYFRYGGYPSYF